MFCVSNPSELWPVFSERIDPKFDSGINLPTRLTDLITF